MSEFETILRNFEHLYPNASGNLIRAAAESEYRWRNGHPSPPDDGVVDLEEYRRVLKLTGTK